jgi:hypothetical protein
MNSDDNGNDDEDDDDDDDDPLPPSSLRRRRAAVIDLDSDDGDDDMPMAKRRKPSSLSSNSQSSNSSAKKARRAPSKKSYELGRSAQASSSPTKPRGHRTEKQKKMELLRRRRAGEKIDNLTSSESSDDNKKRGIYDSDDDDEFEVLREFEDDEEPDEQEQAEETPSSSKKKPRGSVKKKSQGNSGGGNGEDLEDFVVEDDDAPLGAPAYLDIPLEFTSQAHKPLKDQFPFVVEWLVHNKINPAFDRRDALYNNAWRKLDDEVRGLAQSKFTSSAWKLEFYRTLKGRPRIESFEMDLSDPDKYMTCEACGRSGHPSSFRLKFEGRPYRKDTLEEIETDSETDSDNPSDDHESVDSQDNPLAPASKQWVVGSVCCSNAETAHSLIHWKHALKEWVEDRLKSDGWMKASKLKEREKMKPKKRRNLANKIVDQWKEADIVTALYGDFKANLEDARQKTTTGSRGGRWR